MINVTPAAASKITELLVEENKLSCRSESVRPGGRLLGLSIWVDD